MPFMPVISFSKQQNTIFAKPNSMIIMILQYSFSVSKKERQCLQISFFEFLCGSVHLDLKIVFINLPFPLVLPDHH